MWIWGTKLKKTAICRNAAYRNAATKERSLSQIIGLTVTENVYHVHNFSLPVTRFHCAKVIHVEKVAFWVAKSWLLQCYLTSFCHITTLYKILASQGDTCLKGKANPYSYLAMEYTVLDIKYTVHICVYLCYIVQYSMKVSEVHYNS